MKHLMNSSVLALFLSVLAILISSFTLYKDKFNHPISNNNQLNKILLDRTRACVVNSEDITQKESVLTLIDCLEQDGTVSECGSDDLRIKYVFAQGSIEHVLACALVLGDMENLVGIIHTPTPATPLCTKVDHLDEQLLDSSIRYDLEKLLTVRSRAVVVREYLENGGKLFVAYPKGGLEKRSAEQQTIYKQELERYTGRLFDAMLSCSEMDPNMIGATYFFKSPSGEAYYFSIKANQANSPKANSEWGLWMGRIAEPTINQRVNDVLDYVKAHEGPDLRKELSI